MEVQFTLRPEPREAHQILCCPFFVGALRVWERCRHLAFILYGIWQHAPAHALKSLTEGRDSNLRKVYLPLSATRGSFQSFLHFSHLWLVLHNSHNDVDAVDLYDVLWDAQITLDHVIYVRSRRINKALRQNCKWILLTVPHEHRVSHPLSWFGLKRMYSADKWVHTMYVRHYQSVLLMATGSSPPKHPRCTGAATWLSCYCPQSFPRIHLILLRPDWGTEQKYDRGHCPCLL